VTESPRIAVIGAGNIGSALIGGILKSGVTPPANLVATTATADHAAEVAHRFGIQAAAGNNAHAVSDADVVVIAVKPGRVAGVLEEIRWELREDRVLVSLAAAFPIALIDKLIGRRMAIFRAMPNIPVVVEEGATGLAYNAHVTPQQIALIESIFRAVGAVCVVDEDLLHAVTALSGSGPAYAYMVIEAMIAGGLKMGLPHDVATRLAEQTVLGAAKLVRQTGHHPAILRDQVITPGGTTISAIHELERHGLRSMMITAIETATKHSRYVTSQLVDKHNLAR
jgi:pyrroline-5-carboxylate reductase